MKELIFQKTQTNDTVDRGKEAFGYVKSRFLNRNSNETEYILNSNNDEENENYSKKEEIEKTNKINLQEAYDKEKQIEEELINNMQDVLGANSVYSQIIYAEFVLMFFSILSIIASMINYEMNFSQAHLIKLTLDNYQSIINITTNLLNTSTCVTLIINIYFRYKFQIKFEAYTHNLTHQDNLISSGYIKNVIYESLLVVIHPNIFLEGQTFRYRKTYAIGYPTEFLYFTYNEVLLSLMMFRVYFVIKFFLTMTLYQTSRAARTCRLYGETNSYLFAVRCLFNKHPFYFVVVMFSCCLTFFTITIRMFERVFYSPERNSAYAESKEASNILEMNNFFNVTWTVFITLLTVGYGDFYAKTIFGRIYTLIGILAGLLTTSLVTVGFFKNLELSPVENKVFILLERMKLRHKHNDLSKEMVEILMLHFFTKFKAKKIKENLEKNYEEMTEYEKSQAEEEIAHWVRKKEEIEIDIKHLVRDKNIANKNLDNINSSTHVMESIIDDITAIINDVDESYFATDKIVKNFENNFKNDEAIINSIKKHIKQVNNKKLKGKSNVKKSITLSKSNLDIGFRMSQLEMEIEQMSMSKRRNNLGG